MAEAKLPITLDWYRQAANWIVGLCTGGLAWLASLYKDSIGAGCWVSLLFGLSALMFLLAVAFGAYFYMLLGSFGNKRERVHELKVELGGNIDDTRRKELQEKLDALEGERKPDNDKIGSFHHGMLWTFFPGLFFSALLVFALKFSETDHHVLIGQVTEIGVDDGTEITPTPPSTTVVNVPEPPESPIESDGSPTIWYVLAGIGFLIAIASLIFIKSITLKLITCSLGSLLGGVSILEGAQVTLIDKLRLELKWISESASPRIEAQTRMERLGTYGPFTTAKAEPQKEDYTEIERERLRARLAPAHGDSLIAVLIVGHADKRRLLSGPAATFGSNENLALARAMYVKEKILEALVPDTSIAVKLVLLNSGALRIGTKPSDAELAMDRSVEVIALWSSIRLSVPDSRPKLIWSSTTNEK